MFRFGAKNVSPSSSPARAPRACARLNLARASSEIPWPPGDQRLVERRRQRDGLWEDGGLSGARHAVQRFVPPIVGRDAQARDRRRFVHQSARFLGRR